jgi:hypothetical protein
MARTATRSKGTAATVRRQRAIQKGIDAKDARKPAKKQAAAEKKPPVQAGVRRQPQNPLPL